MPSLSGVGVPFSWRSAAGMAPVEQDDGEADHRQVDMQPAGDDGASPADAVGEGLRRAGQRGATVDGSQA
jgi:hypothetical protein